MNAVLAALFYINSRGGVLGGLAMTCRNAGLVVDNIEYRYCRVSSLGPVLNNLQQRVHTIPSARGVLVGDVAKEIHDVAQELKRHSGHAALCSFRDEALSEVMPQLASFQLEAGSQQTVADYLRTHSKRTTRLPLLKKLLTFDSILLDVKLAHSVLTGLDYTTVVALAGGSHISRVSEMLQKSGYELAYTTNAQFLREHNLERCLGSHIIDGLFCMRPEPIKLDAIKKYLPSSNVHF